MAREEDLLPVKYFHLIFTLPEQLNELCMFHPVEMYNLLFRTVWDVLSSYAGDEKWLGGKLGAIAILHTWSQTLMLHPHIHLIIPAGGITPKGNWKVSKTKGKFLFDVTQMSPVFRARFVAGLAAGYFILSSVKIPLNRFPRCFSACEFDSFLGILRGTKRTRLPFPGRIRPSYETVKPNSPRQQPIQWQGTHQSPLPPAPN